MSFVWEMKDGDKYITNAVRFATKEEAQAYGIDLSCRWLAMPEPARVGEREDPVNYRWVDGRLVNIETPAEATV